MKREIPAGRAVPADWLSNFDRYLISEGTHERAYEKLGAHLVSFDRKEGVVFAVWAPNARQVTVIGDFNGWNTTSHPMHSSDAGIWTLFIPGLAEYSVYKFHIIAQDYQQFDKADPFGFAMEERPRTGSVVADLDSYQWHDDEWIADRRRHQALDSPIAISEVHLGSWRREADAQWGMRYLSYRELAATLIP